MPTLIRTTAEVAAAAARTPYSEKDLEAAGTFAVALVRTPLDAAGKKGLASLETPVDRFVLHGREVYWLAKTKQSETKITIVKFERAVGCAATMRAMTSLRKLAAKHCT